MPSKKKKFINKKEAVTFHLVHRSQKDPLIVNEESSKHVLVETAKKDSEKRKEEQRKYGVFYDDEYDYMQHLREREEVFELEPVNETDDREIEEKEEKKQPKINLPSSVFPSDYEKKVGLLNELPARGPQPSWDPDIVEALDDDFDFDDPDNVLDDDFVVQAQQPGEDGENADFEFGNELDDDFVLRARQQYGEGEMQEGSDLESVSDLDSNEAMTDDDFDPDFEYGDRMFMNEETKSRFTNYSMSSSVIRRNEGLVLLDDRFEKLFEEYDDEEIGALDNDEIDGKMKQDNALFQNIMEEFEKKQKQKLMKDALNNSEEIDEDILSDASDDSETEIIQVEVKPDQKWDCESILSTYSNLYNHPKLITEPKKKVEVKPDQKWDCESILSTYSNLYNHPKLITEPKKVNPVKLKGVHGIPEDHIATRGLTEKEIQEDIGRERSDRASTYRPKGETTAEKTQRKKAVKEERRERRQEKKGNKMAFKKEKIRQEKEIVNLNQNLGSVRIL